MKKLLLSTITAAVFAVGTNAYALIASDNGGNYGGGWTNGANGGSGFGAWSITASSGGNFIGDPSSGGIGGMAANSFGLFANPTNSGVFVDAVRPFSTAMSVGDTFSFQWGVNWDANGPGNKGFNLYTGGASGTQLVNVNMGGSDTITFNSADTGFTFGTNAMSWSFTLANATTLSVVATPRGIGANFTTNVTISGSPDAVKWYASQLDAGDNRQPYFNNLSVVPEPSTYALLALSAAGLAGYASRRRARK